MKKLLLVLALLCPAAFATVPTLVQSKACTVSAARPTSLACVFTTANVTAGNQLMVWIIRDNAPSSVTTSVTDTVVADSFLTQTSTSLGLNVYHVVSAVGGATTVTANYGAGTNTSMVIEEWANLDTSQLWYDVYAKKTNATTTTVSCNTTPTSNTAADEIVWAVYASYQSRVFSGGPPSGYGLDNETTDSAADSVHVYSKSASGFGTQTAASLTISGADNNICLVIVAHSKNPGTVTATSLTSPGTCADLAGVGTVTWTNPTNAQVADAVYATAGGGTTHYLKCNNFGFSVGGTVVGVKVTIVEDASCTIGCDGGSNPSTLKLNLAAGVSGNNRCLVSTYNGTLDTVTCSVWANSSVTTRSFGGQTDTWGIALLSSDVNDTNFGVALSMLNDIGSGGTQVSKVDVIQVTVYTLNTVKRRVEIIAQTGYAVIPHGL